MKIRWRFIIFSSHACRGCSNVFVIDFDQVFVDRDRPKQQPIFSIVSISLVTIVEFGEINVC